MFGMHGKGICDGRQALPPVQRECKACPHSHRVERRMLRKSYRNKFGLCLSVQKRTAICSKLLTCVNDGSWGWVQLSQYISLSGLRKALYILVAKPGVNTAPTPGGPGW
jgi:hypothetical protein